MQSNLHYILFSRKFFCHFNAIRRFWKVRNSSKFESRFHRDSPSLIPHRSTFRSRSVTWVFVTLLCIRNVIFSSPCEPWTITFRTDKNRRAHGTQDRHGIVVRNRQLIGTSYFPPYEPDILRIRNPPFHPRRLFQRHACVDACIVVQGRTSWNSCATDSH